MPVFGRLAAVSGGPERARTAQEAAWGPPVETRGSSGLAKPRDFPSNTRPVSTLTKGERLMAIRVKARGGESMMQMLRRFKKLCEKEGLTKEVKRRQYFEKPSERRRRAMRKAIQRQIRLKEPDKN